MIIWIVVGLLALALLAFGLVWLIIIRGYKHPSEWWGE